MEMEGSPPATQALDLVASLVPLRVQAHQQRIRDNNYPGTPDEVLARRFFGSLYDGKDMALPSFDKRRFNGEGDCVPEDKWQKIFMIRL
ncbi:hypothetical protein F5Y09DRAFT_339897 [Xylaria sp. FL1042]|nr:hypothetical protein F5Y09DRAFT_339897 [Xylaria sp. FL1042]